MITEKDLREAIAECQGERNPNAHTCIKLAAYYTILNQLSRPEEPGYSYAPGPRLNTESEFAQVVNGMDDDQVWPVMDELMETLQALNPRLYGGVLRRLRNSRG